MVFRPWRFSKSPYNFLNDYVRTAWKDCPTFKTLNLITADKRFLLATLYFLFSLNLMYRLERKKKTICS